MQLLQVQEYNRRQKEKYENDILKWRKDHKFGYDGMPFLPMYLFLKEDGTVRKKGFVVSHNNGSKFCLTKKELDRVCREFLRTN